MKELIEEMCKSKLEYLFLAQFISADVITSNEKAQKALKMIKEVEDALPEANISDEKKSEFREYLKNGKELINRDWKVE